MLMQNNSDTTRTHNPILQAYVRVRLTNVLIDNVGLKRTIYYYHLTHLLQKYLFGKHLLLLLSIRKSAKI